MGGYRELKVWQSGINICLAVYNLTQEFPSHEIYGLTSQLRRAAVSVPSNLAEGHTRGSTRDMLRFVNIARGSLAELETQLYLAKQLGYGNAESLAVLAELTEEESRMLSGLRRSLISKLES